MCYFAKLNENLSIDYCIILPTDIFWHILVVTEIKMKQLFSLINSKKEEKININNIEGKPEGTERRGIRRKQLVYGFKKKRKHWNLKAKAQDRPPWKTWFERGYGLSRDRILKRFLLTFTFETLFIIDTHN
jgi:hypothetical protein